MGVKTLVRHSNNSLKLEFLLIDTYKYHVKP